MVSNELSNALRKLETSLSKKIDQIVSKRPSSFNQSQTNLRSNFEAKDSIKVTSPVANAELNFVSWVLKKLFNR
jgi:hypothetical protein